MASLGGCSGDQPLQTSSLLTRRRVLGTAVAATSVAFITPVPAVSFAPRSVSLYNTHTGEWVRSVYWADGHYIREAVKDINWVLRDHHSGDVCRASGSAAVVTHAARLPGSFSGGFRLPLSGDQRVDACASTRRGKQELPYQRHGD